MKKSKHDSLCNLVKESIKGWYEYVTTDVDYIHGQLDVFARDGARNVYYEIKSNFSPKSYKKGKEQLMRWTKYMYKRNPGNNYYGVYYSPQLVRLICKNGRRR